MSQLPDIRHVQVTRYISPLREGGSLPALADADDGFKYVLKFKGAGHGVKALIAEFIGGELARFLGLKMPEIVFASLDEAFGRTEADEEIQDLLQGSRGLNLGMHFLSGAVTFDPVVTEVDALLASKIVWLDAFLTNVDRTAKNTNMLIWHKELWLIDHGATLFFHHAWDHWEKHASSPFAYIKEHVLLSRASQLEEVNTLFCTQLNPEILRELVEKIPLEWLQWEGGELSPAQIKDVYFQFLTIRLSHSSTFVNEALHARATGV
ncbi:MAG: hypothetical protein RLZZ543_396 [Bacteroidota bacterium]|jgi:hypothetical protein